MSYMPGPVVFMLTYVLRELPELPSEKTESQRNYRTYHRDSNGAELNCDPGSLAPEPMLFATMPKCISLSRRAYLVVWQHFPSLDHDLCSAPLTFLYKSIRFPSTLGIGLCTTSCSLHWKSTNSAPEWRRGSERPVSFNSSSPLNMPSGRLEHPSGEESEEQKIGYLKGFVFLGVKSVQNGK